jgi:hypothetical protein
MLAPLIPRALIQEDLVPVLAVVDLFEERVLCG